MASTERYPHWQVHQGQGAESLDLIYLTVHMTGPTEGSKIHVHVHSDTFPSHSACSFTVEGQVCAPRVPLGVAVEPNPRYIRYDNIKGTAEVAFVPRQASEREGGGEGGDMYHRATELANKEAAREAYVQANKLVQQQKWTRAMYLMKKAAQLDPEYSIYPGSIDMLTRLEKQQQQSQSRQNKPTNDTSNLEDAPIAGAAEAASDACGTASSTAPTTSVAGTGRQKMSPPPSSSKYVPPSRPVTGLQDLSFSELKNESPLRALAGGSILVAVMALKLWMTGGDWMGICLGVLFIASAAPGGSISDYFLTPALWAPLVALLPITFMRYVNMIWGWYFVTGPHPHPSVVPSSVVDVLKRLPLLLVPPEPEASRRLGIPNNPPRWSLFWSCLTAAPTLGNAVLLAFISCIAVLWMVVLQKLGRGHVERKRKKGKQRMATRLAGSSRHSMRHDEDGNTRLDDNDASDAMPLLDAAKFGVEVLMWLPMFAWAVGSWAVGSPVFTAAFLFLGPQFTVSMMYYPPAGSSIDDDVRSDRGSRAVSFLHALLPLAHIAFWALTRVLVFPLIGWIIRVTFWTPNAWISFGISSVLLTEKHLDWVGWNAPLFRNKLILTAPMWWWLWGGRWRTLMIVAVTSGPDVLVIMAMLLKPSLWNTLPTKLKQAVYCVPPCCLAGIFLHVDMGWPLVWVCVPLAAGSIAASLLVVDLALALVGGEEGDHHTTALGTALGTLLLNAVYMVAGTNGDRPYYTLFRGGAREDDLDDLDTWPPMMDPLPVPPGAPPLIADILMATNHYAVLGVPQTAGNGALRRAKRTLSLASHPDKAAHVPGAGAACQRVLTAADVLLDAETRAVYDEEMNHAKILSSRKSSEVMEDLADEMFDRTGVDITRLEDTVLMACDSCARGFHQIPVVPNVTPSSARPCAECGSGVKHPVIEGESWVEARTSMAWTQFKLGRELRMFVCHKGSIYDATEIGTCSGILKTWAQSQIPVNTHLNPLMEKGTAKRQGKKRGRGGGKGGSSGAKNTGVNGGGVGDAARHRKTSTSTSKKKGGRRARVPA